MRLCRHATESAVHRRSWSCSRASRNCGDLWSSVQIPPPRPDFTHETGLRAGFVVLAPVGRPYLVSLNSLPSSIVRRGYKVLSIAGNARARRPCRPRCCPRFDSSKRVL
jgi:hypothetical protein